MSMVGCVVGPQVIFAPSGNFTEEPRGPLEFWETEEYKKDFDEAYDRVKWPWLHKDNPLSEEEFKELFPKWPDGVDYSGGYEWAKFEYDGPPIDWPGLNPDGTCSGKRLVCQEQVEYNLNKLKEQPTIVAYEDVLTQNNNTIINPEEIDLSEVIVGEMGPDFDPNTITNNNIDTSSFTNEIDKMNETVAQVTGNISDTTESIDTFMEQVDNINESVAQATESMNDTVAEISESIDTESISSGIEAFTNSDELTSSFDAIENQMNDLIQSTEEIKETLLNQDLNDYLDSPAMELPCTPMNTWSWDTMSYTQSTTCD